MTGRIFSTDDRFRQVICLHMAGGISATAWICLARCSFVGAPALGCMLAVITTAWAALVFAMRTVKVSASGIILAWALVFRCVAFAVAPVMEDDYYRFLWDGYQFAQNGNPFSKPPQASFGDPKVPPAFQEILDHINHPDVPTIYGPCCQWMFRASYLLAPTQLWPWKLVLLAAELTTIVLLWPALSVRGRLLLTWCPLAVFETILNAHPDALAIAFLIVAWRCGQHGRATAAGVMAGMAITAKIFALWLVPFLLFRLPRRAKLAAAGTIIVFYAPFWIRGSLADFAGLKAMASEWEFNSSIYAVVATIAPQDLARMICAVAFGGIWIWLFTRWIEKRSSGELPPGEWVYAAFLLLSTTANPWYCLWLLPFVAARVSVVGVCALAAVSLSYVTGFNLASATLGNFEQPVWVRPLEFGLVGLAACWTAISKKPQP